MGCWNVVCRSLPRHDQVSSSTGSGSDEVGAFNSTSMFWDGGAFVTTIRAYADALIFEQTFPKGVSASSPQGAGFSARDTVSSGFPSLAATAVEELG